MPRSTPQQAADFGGFAKAAVSNDATRQEFTPYNAPIIPSEFAQALRSTGISRQTAHRYQAVANVPDAVVREVPANLSKPPIGRASVLATLREARFSMPQGGGFRPRRQAAESSWRATWRPRNVSFSEPLRAATGMSLCTASGA